MKRLVFHAALGPSVPGRDSVLLLADEAGVGGASLDAQLLPELGEGNSCRQGAHSGVAPVAGTRQGGVGVHCELMGPDRPKGLIALAAAEAAAAVAGGGSHEVVPVGMFFPNRQFVEGSFWLCIMGYHHAGTRRKAQAEAWAGGTITRVGAPLLLLLPLRPSSTHHTHLGHPACHIDNTTGA